MPALATIRNTILLAFKSLPLLIISFIGFVAIGLGNLALFILFIGHAIVVPVLTEMLHLVFNGGNLIAANDISQLVPLNPIDGTPYGTPVNIMPTYWMAHMSFFFGYMLSNAVILFSLPSDKKSPDWIVESRKTRAVTVMITTIVLLILLSVLRFVLTGTESLGGILLAWIVLGGAGGGWYLFAQVCGARNADIFGVAEQMMSPDSSATKPMTCVYAPTP